MIKNKMKIINEKGQTLLFVVVAVTIALSIGIAVSTRTLSSLRRVSRTDTASRAIAVAEGGVENLLNQTYGSLEEVLVGSETICDPNECLVVTITCRKQGGTGYPHEYIKIKSEQFNPPTSSNGNLLCKAKWSNYIYLSHSTAYQVDGPTCGVTCIGKLDESICSIIDADYDDQKGKCFYPFGESASIGDLISSRAVVGVEYFNSNDGEGYSFPLDPDSVREINLSGYASDTIKICWENPQTAIYYYSYNALGGILKGGIYNSSTFSNAVNVNAFDSNDISPDYGFPYCRIVSVVAGKYGLRIRTLYNPSKVGIFPVAPFTLPIQGYKLISRGEINPSASGAEPEVEVATVIVYKSFPYPSPAFDYGIYTPGSLSGSGE